MQDTNVLNTAASSPFINWMLFVGIYLKLVCPELECSEMEWFEPGWLECDWLECVWCKINVLINAALSQRKW